MSTQLSQIDDLLRKYLGVGLGLALTLLAFLAVAGIAVSLSFPKFEATALLQFPESQKIGERPGEPKLPEQRTIDPKANVIELAAYKRVAASYDSVAQLSGVLGSCRFEQPSWSRTLAQAGREP